MATVAQLRQQAKARKIKGYSKMNKTSLMSALGVSDKTARPKGDARARSTANKHGVAKSFAADKLASKFAGSDGAKKEQIKKRIVSSVSKELKSQEKKLGRKLSIEEKRAAAIKAIKSEASAIRGGQKLTKKDGVTPFKSNTKPGDISIHDLSKSERMLKRSFFESGKAEGKSKEQLESGWARIKLQNQHQIDEDVSSPSSKAQAKKATDDLAKQGRKLRAIDGGSKTKGKSTAKLTAKNGGAKSLKDLFDEADKIGAKYQDEPTSIEGHKRAKKKAAQIVEESGLSRATSRAVGKSESPIAKTRSERIKDVLTPKQNDLQLSPERKAAFGAHGKLVGKQNWTAKDHEKAETTIARLKKNGDFTQAASLIDKRNREQRKQSKATEGSKTRKSERSEENLKDADRKFQDAKARADEMRSKAKGEIVPTRTPGKEPQPAPRSGARRRTVEGYRDRERMTTGLAARKAAGKSMSRASKHRVAIRDLKQQLETARKKADKSKIQAEIDKHTYHAERHHERAVKLLDRARELGYRDRDQIWNDRYARKQAAEETIPVKYPGKGGGGKSEIRRILESKGLPEHTRSVSVKQILGLKPGATPEDVKRNYRKLSAKYHPDANRGASPEQLERNRRKLELVQQAYQAYKKKAER